MDFTCDYCGASLHEYKYRWIDVREWEMVPTSEGGTFVRKIKAFCGYSCLNASIKKMQDLALESVGMEKG
jgi:hypothetical protein